MNIPSMEKMIEGCEKKRNPDETIAFAIGAGRMMPFPTDRRKIRKAMQQGMDAIKEQDGFIGIHPVDIWHNMLIFDTLNHAKGARNSLLAKGMELGQIVPILVPITFASMERIDNGNE